MARDPATAMALRALKALEDRARDEQASFAEFLRSPRFCAIDPSPMVTAIADASEGRAVTTITDVEAHPSQPKTFYVAGATGGIWKTVNAGTTFVRIKGKPLIINVWASWCGPCRAEMGSLDRIAKRHNGRQFHIIGISTDDYADKAQRFVTGTGIS